MHPALVRARVIDLLSGGLSDSAIALEVGLPRTTIRDIRRAQSHARSRLVCPRCWRPTRSVRFKPNDYAELLGLYLGDGYISRAGRAARLRVSLDARYPKIVSDAERLLRRCFPENSIGSTRADDGATVVLSVYSTHLPCLFPQLGVGKKHERRIVLEDWQKEQLTLAPWAFLRGCIRSNGCTFVNRTGPYSYLPFDFRNSSRDILALFAGACDLVGLEYRFHDDRIRINRRQSVEQMVTRVGVKA